MTTEIFKDNELLAEAVADLMIKSIIDKPSGTFCLASGSSPERAYEIFTEKIKLQNIDCKQLTIIALDEWVGISREDSGSCYYFLNKYIVKPLGLGESQCHFFDPIATDFTAECDKIDQLISENGIDLIIVGIGLNGHIGFNEPGISPEKKCHVIDLDEVTKTVGQKYFDQPTVLAKGITVGLKHFMEAKMAILMANGVKKAEIIAKTIQEKVKVSVPSTHIQWHKNAKIMVDTLAGSLI